MLLTLVVAIVVLELVALGLLRRSVDVYKDFWVHKSQESGEITYLALGDSAAQGIGATSPMRGYAGLIAKRLEQKTGKRVKVINTSVTGATLNDYLTKQVPQLAQIKADIVTIEIGANDIKSFNEEKFRAEFEQVLESLPDGTYVSNMPLFNSRRSSTAPAKQASKIIEELIVAYPKLHFVNLEKQTSEHKSIFGFAPDLFHPNNLSYKNWADAFWNEIEKEL